MKWTEHISTDQNTFNLSLCHTHTLNYSLTKTQPVRVFVLATLFVKASNEARDFPGLDICQACCEDIFHHTSYTSWNSVQTSLRGKHFSNLIIEWDRHRRRLGEIKNIRPSTILMKWKANESTNFEPWMRNMIFNMNLVNQHKCYNYWKIECNKISFDWKRDEVFSCFC